MADVKWIKITTDMFDNKKIKQLRKLPDGNNIVLIWVMLITMAGRCNSDGKIFLTEDIPYTTKTLAIELDFEESTVSFALKMLSKFGMIRTDDDYISISNWGVYQNIDGMERIREQTRNRVAKYRENKKQIAGSVTSSVTVTQGNAIDKEEEKEEDKKEGKEKPPSYQHIVEMYNSICISLPTVTVLSESRKKAIKARFASGYTDEDFQKLFTMAEGSAFLKGKNARNWQANFDWLIKDANMAKVLDGNYNDSKTPPRQAGTVYNGYSDEDLNALDDLY